MDLRTFLYRLPKAELHTHLAGTVSGETFLELARKNEVDVSALTAHGKVYDFRRWTLPQMLLAYRLVGKSLRDRADFERVTYETLHEAADCGVRYREMSWSPTDHLDVGVPYQLTLQGIVDGIKAAEADFGIQCRLIAAINREDTPERAQELVRMVTESPSEYVIGVGMDYDETANPPEQFWKAFKLAASRGLHRTAHACEIGGPPGNVETCLDLLGCERIDHGYRVLESPEITQRCAGEGVVFCVVPTTMRYVPRDDQGELVWRAHPIRSMVEQGLRVAVNSDDPGIMETNPAEAYVIASWMGFRPQDFKAFVLNGLAASWLEDGVKAEWIRGWSEEVDALLSQVGP